MVGLTSNQIHRWFGEDQASGSGPCDLYLGEYKWLVPIARLPEEQVRSVSIIRIQVNDERSFNALGPCIVVDMNGEILLWQ